MDKTRLVPALIGIVPALLIVLIAASSPRLERPIETILSFVGLSGGGCSPEPGVIASLNSIATAQEAPPAPSLQSLATEDVDFRACDRDWNKVNGGSSGASPDSPEKASLENLAAPAGDVRGDDRDWCHVDDFWSANGAEQTTSLVEVSAGESPD